MTNYTSVKISSEDHVKEKFFRKNEIDRMYDTDPAFFISRITGGGASPLSPKELNTYCQALLQDTFHVILRRYIKISEEVFFQVCQEELELFRLTYRIITQEELICPQGATETMCVLYHALRKLVSIRGERELEIKIGAMLSKEIEVSAQIRKWQREVIDFIGRSLKSNFTRSVHHAFLQGSFSTSDFISDWSDLDVIIFLKKDVFVSVESLREFRNNIENLSLLVYKIDPLAHHEFMVFTDFDREHYPSFLFPSVLYSYAQDLLGGEKIFLRPRPEFHERIAPVMRLTQYFRKKVMSGSISQDDFSWKNDLSLVMLFPSLILGAMGVEVYKKFSFVKFQEALPLINFSSVDMATQIRKNWRRTNLLQFIPNCLFVHVPPRFVRKVVAIHRRFFASRGITKGERQKRNDLYCRFLALAEASVDVLLQ